MLHSVYSRANIIFTFYTTVLGVVLVFVAASSFLFPFRPAGKIVEHDVLLRPVQRKGFEVSRLDFDLDVDLRGAFNWNTKQLFVWVTAEYSTPKFKRNEVVVWDYLVLSKDEANLHFPNVTIKYPLYDRAGEFRGTNVVLSVRYALCPHTGLLWTRESSSALSSFSMPAEYSNAYPSRPAYR